MYIVYLLEFNNTDEIYIGLSDNLNWQLELENKFFKTQYNLEITQMKILSFTLNKQDAKIDKEMWINKTKQHNINSTFTDKAPDLFISQSLKDKQTLQDELKKLEDKYISLYCQYNIIKENSSDLNQIIEQSIQESIEAWKYDELSIQPISGYDADGYNDHGHNRLGYDEDGLDKYGYDKDGCDITGLDKEGYDKDGFDIYGYDRKGFDLDGLDKDGNEFVEKKKKKRKKVISYDNDGFDSSGIDRFGRTRDYYMKEELINKKVSKSPSNRSGLDENQYDKDGYNQKGWNKDGYNKVGLHKDGYDENGLDKYGKKCCLILI